MMSSLHLLWIALLSALVSALDVKPWTRYIYAPDSRTPVPESIKQIKGLVTVHSNDTLDVTLSSSDSQVTFDFGREVGGHISFLIESTSESPISLSFSESPLFVGEWSDDTGASPFSDWDRALNVAIPSEALGTVYNYTTPVEKFRGGFRFLTIVANPQLSTPVNISISNLICLLGFHPGISNLREAYTGYFYSPHNDILTRTWYAGAYTVQTNIAPPNTGRYLPQLRPGWAYNATLTGTSNTSIEEGAVLLDGAKRDRAIWPGDLGISAPSSYLAFGPRYGGYEGVLNALEVLFWHQDRETGIFPFAGPDTVSFRSGSRSDTYHSWTLFAIWEYVLYGGDEGWVDWHWENITRAVEYVIEGIGEEGLQNQTYPNDWARQGGGGLNVALNALSYKALKSMSTLASSRDPSLSEAWNGKAEAVKTAFNVLLWDDQANLYRDNTTTTSLYPQDGNSLAIVFNLTTSAEQRKRISEALTRNWNDIGPVTPELPDTISPFVSSWEVEAHFIAGEPDRAIELIRQLWGYILDAPHLGGSTIVEGLAANGSLYYRSQAGYNYDPAYTSLAHSWSTGPTQSLLTRLLGLRILSGAGKTWELRPALGAGGIQEVEGGFETILGFFEAHWKIEKNRTVIEVKAPTGTRGRMLLAGKEEDGPSEVYLDNSRVELKGGLELELELDGKETWSVIKIRQ